MRAPPSHPICRARLKPRPVFSVPDLADAIHRIRLFLAVVDPLAAKFGRRRVEFPDLPDRFFLRRNTRRSTTENQAPKSCSNRELRSARESFHQQAHHFGCTVIAPGRFGSSIHDPICRFFESSWYFASLSRSSRTPRPGPVGTAIFPPARYGSLPPSIISSVR